MLSGVNARERMGIMSAFKFFMKVFAFIMAVAAAMAAIYVFRDRLEELLETAEEKYENCPIKKRFSPEEVSDFADLDE